MTVSRPARVNVGDEVLLGGRAHTVVGLSGTSVRLLDVVGQESTIALSDLFTDAGFMAAGSERAPMPPSGLLDGLPEQVVAAARWWEHHIVEVICGLPPESKPGTRPRPQYDPESCSLRQREMAKVTELAGLDRPVPLSTLQRLRAGYEKDGVWALVDHRAAESLRRPAGRIHVS